MLFPVKSLKIKKSDFAPQNELLSISIFLEPFEYFDDGEIFSAETSIVLPDIDFGANTAQKLSGKAINFPTNPEQGYIDSSVYIGHAHHPFDVSKFQFDAISKGAIQAQITAKFIFSYEGLGAYEDTPWNFELEIPISALKSQR